MARNSINTYARTVYTVGIDVSGMDRTSICLFADGQLMEVLAMPNADMAAFAKDLARAAQREGSNG